MSFKLFLESGIAHVGAEQDQRSGGLYEPDAEHMNSVADWLGEHDPKFFDYIVQSPQDYVELSQGRDFLKENKKYDMVILHHIYAPKYKASVGLYQTSDIHSPDEWRKRLSDTDAKYIFAFGDETEVSGRYLGNIPMYINVGPFKYDRGRYNYSPDFTVYMKATEDIEK